MVFTGNVDLFTNPTGNVSFYDDSVQTINLTLINYDTLKVE